MRRFEFEPTGQPEFASGKGSLALDGSYEPPFRFTGIIHSVTIDVSGELIKDEKVELASLMSQQ